MHRNKYLLSLGLVAYIIYSLQGALFASGTYFTQMLLLMFLLIGVYGYIKTTFQDKNNPQFVSVLAFFFFILTITYFVSPKNVYGRVYEALGQMTTFGQYKNICFVILSFYAVYYFAKMGVATEKRIYKLGLVFLVVALIRYFYSLQMLHQELKMENFQNNAAYNIIAIIPFLPFIFKKNKIITLCIVATLIALVFNAAKRGAIVCLIVSFIFIIVYLLRSSKITRSSQFVLIALVIIAGIFMYYITIQNEFLMDRLDQTREGNIGNRKIAYIILWNYWLNADSIFHMIFGNGLLQSVNVWGNSAHNDWLELLIDNGLLGAIIYLVFFYTLFRYIKRMKENSLLQISAYLSTIILFTKSFFSMGYTDFVNVPLFIALGLCVGTYEANKEYN